MLTAPASSYTGRVVGEFVLEDQIGEGGGGAVYRAFQPVLQRAAVVKLRPSDRTAERVDRFLQEARLASRLDHPYAAHIYAFGVENDGLMWIAMELVRGTPLSALLEAGPIDRGLELIARICEVVQSTHEIGIIHGDLKPSNIMVISRVGNLFPKLLDFGIARELDDNISGGAGTPLYMAPEQWVKGRELTPATDVYALGALAFEVLTGHAPFAAPTRIELAKHHARTPPPALPESFPVRLSAVIARAMAKAPADRFASVADLARAITGEQALASINVPRLDDLTRDDALLGAPEPIAEAVVLLDAATEPIPAYTAAWDLVSTIAQYLGALAIGCRARIRGIDSEAAGRTLAELRERGLGAAGWWRLARELARPFAALRDAYPIPELVATFFDGLADVTTAIDLALADGSSRLDAPTNEVAIAELARMIPPLGIALRSLHWLREYRLVAPTRGGAQPLMGLRRSDRPRIDLAALPIGPALLGQSGAIVLDLSTIVDFQSPVPGAARRLFFLDGPGRHGARMRAMPGNLQRELDGAWERLSIAGETTDDQIAEAASPYMGLATFTAAQAALFFGRERELEELLNRLVGRNRIAIVGPSGAGKSSFVRAGLFPALGETWHQLVLRPGTAPLAALAAATSAVSKAELSAAEVRKRPAIVGERLAQTALRIVILVDQFEEVFTLSPDAEDQTAFVDAVLGAADATERIRLVITLRDDFLVRAAQVPALREIASWLQILTTPAPEHLMRILVEPARRSGYAFEDDELIREIIAELSDQPGALALLSFTAAKLWGLRDRQSKQLTRRAYRALGGVGGALAQHGESVLGALTEERQRIVRELFRHLMTAEGTRAVLSRDELLQVGGGEAAQPVIETLITERLLTAMEVPGGESIEVVHETLLVSWPRLVRWRALDAENARLRDQLRAAAKQWDTRGRQRGMLWRSDALTEYRLWRSRYPGSLTTTEEAFGAASLADSQRGRRIRRALASFAAVALVTALVIFARLRSEAVDSSTKARSQLLDSYREQAERALASGDGFGALIFLEGAVRLGADSRALRFMIARATESVTPEAASMKTAPGLTAQLAFMPDGSVVGASIDGVVTRWDTGGRPQWAVHAYPAGSDIVVAASPTGAVVASAAGDAVDVWTPDGKLGRHLDGHSGQIIRMAFTHAGLLVSAAADGTARITDPATGDARILDLGTKGRTVCQVAGDYVIAASWGEVSGAPRGSFAVWSPDLTSLPTPVVVGSAHIITAAISSDGALAALGMLDGSIQIWNVPSHQLVRTLTGHTGLITLLLFANSGELVSGGVDGTLRSWNPTSGEALRTLGDHLGQITQGGIDSRGRLFAGTATGTARIWDVTSGTILRSFAHGGMLNVAMNADATRLATASDFGSVKLWRTDDPVGVDILTDAAPDPTRSALWIDAKGTRLARHTIRGVELWDLSTRKLIARHGDKTSLVVGRDDRIYVVGPDELLSVRADDGAIEHRAPLPFPAEQACIDSGTGTVVIASGAQHEVASLDGDGRVIAHNTIPDLAAIACEPGQTVTYGAAASFFSLPELKPTRTEKLGQYAVAQAEPGIGVVTQPGRTEIELSHDGQPVTTLQYSDLVTAVASAGSVLSVGLADGTLIEREIGTWKQLSEVRAHPAAILVMASNDWLLASIAMDGTLQLREHGKPHALFQVAGSSLTCWAQFAGDRLIVTDGQRVTVRHVGVSSLSADELERLVACTVPDQIRAQLGGPPRTQPCSDPK